MSTTTVAEQEKKKKKLTPEQEQARIKQLTDFEYETIREIKERDGRVQELTEQVFEPIKDRIKRYAESIEERVQLGEPLGILNVNQISGYIRGIAREKGISEGSIEYITETIDPKYKDPRFVREVANKPYVGKDNLAAEIVKYVPIEALTPQQVQTEAKQLYDELSQIADVKFRKNDRLEELLERAKTDKIALEIPIPKDPNSTPKTESKVTKFSEAIDRGIARLQKLKEKAVEFPPDEKEEEYYAQCVDTFFSIFDPLIDEKWSTDWISPEGWLMAEKENVLQSKHHAGKKYGVETLSGEWRHITREQVGDKYPEVADKVVEFYNAVPGIIGFNHWYLTKVKPRIGERKTGFVNPRWS